MGFAKPQPRPPTRDQLGRWSKSVYNSRGWLTQSIDALGNTTATGYDAAGNVTSTTDALSHSWTTIYDALNRATQQTDPLNHSSTTAFDTVGNVSTVTDALNNITKYAYDVLNRRTSETDAFGSSVARTLSTTYDNVGNALTQTDGINTTTNAFDFDNRQTSSTDGLNHSSSETFDLDSNVASTTDALNKTTTYGYNTLNEENKTTDPLNHVTSSLDDADGNTVETFDALNQPTIQVVDELDRPIDTIDARTGQTLKAYDAVGNLTSLTDPAGNTTRWIYDGDNRQVVAIDPLGNRTTTGFDAASRTTAVTDRDGRQRLYAYDNANRVTSETWKSSGGATVDTLNYTYDSDNNLLTAGNSNGTYTRTYDPLNRMATEQNPFAITLTFSYNSADDRTSVVDSLGGTVNSTYDAAHRLTNRSYVTGGVTQLTMALGYDNRDELTSETRSDLVSGTMTTVGTSTLGYDDAGRLTSLQHKNGAATNLANYGYSYDSADRLSSETLNSGTATNYTYDSTNQLTNDGTSNYTYDLNGNRTISGYVTGSDNRLTTDGVWTYSYDAEGNQTKKTKGVNAETWYYSYDNWNHMTSARQEATDTGPTGVYLMLAVYLYDAFANRIEKDVTQGGVTTVTRFAFDGMNPWADLTGTNALLMRRLFLDGPNTEFARVSSAGTVSWYLPDHLGSIRDITDATGAVADHLNYTVFGGVINETNPAQGDRMGWQGGQRDAESGLNFFFRRYGDPVTFRWTSEDPLGLGPDTNPYRDEGNGPTNAVDPSGLEDTIPIDDPKKHKADYNDEKISPRKVHDPLMIAFDMILSGLPDDGGTKGLHGTVFELGNLPVNMELKMDKYATDTYSLAKASWEDKNGAGWTITPEKFYLGSLRFAQSNRVPGDNGLRTDIAGYTSELGGESWGPRKGDKPAGSVGGPTIVPLMTATGEFKKEDIGTVPTAHFIVQEAYWVYKATKKDEKDKYFAVKFDERARTIIHSAYDERYDRQIAKLMYDYPGAVFGRSYEGINEQATFRTEEQIKKFKDELGALRGYLKIGGKKAMEGDYKGIEVFDPKF